MSLTYKPRTAEVFDGPLQGTVHGPASPNAPVPAFMVRETAQGREGLASGSVRVSPRETWGPTVPAGKPTHPPGTSAPVPRGIKSHISVKDLHAGVSGRMPPTKYHQYRQPFDKLDVHRLVDGARPVPQIDTTRPARPMARLDVTDIPGSSPRRCRGYLTAKEMASAPLGRSLKTSDILGATSTTYVGKKVFPDAARRLHPMHSLPMVSKHDSFGKQVANKDYLRFRSAAPRALFPQVPRVTVLSRPHTIRGTD